MPPVFPGYALLIGVGAHQFLSDRRMPQLAHDALNLATVLQDQHACGYPQDQVQVFTNEAATRQALLNAFNDLANRVTPDDTVLIFYSGYGEYGADGFYLTTYDTQLDDQRVRGGSGLSDVDLLQALSALKAQRVLLIIEASHAQTTSVVTRGLQQPQPVGQSLPLAFTTALLGAGENRVVLLPAGAGQPGLWVASEPATLFVQALARGLSGHDLPDRQGYISIDDLYVYVLKTVNDQTQSWRAQQQPALFVQQGTPAFAVGLHRGATPTSVFQSPDRSSLPTSGSRFIARAEAMRLLHRIMSGALNLNIFAGAGTSTGPAPAPTYSPPVHRGPTREGSSAYDGADNDGADYYQTGSVDDLPALPSSSGNLPTSGTRGGLIEEEPPRAPQQDSVQPRRFEAAMPSVTTVNRATEVRAMVALAASKGLRAQLPAKIKGGDVIQRSDVERREVPVEFPDHRPIYLYIQLEAHDFVIDEAVKTLLVRPDYDSGTATFLLKPKEPCAHAIVSVGLFQDPHCTTLIDSITLDTEIQADQQEPAEAEWQLQQTIMKMVAAGGGAIHIDARQGIFGGSFSGPAIGTVVQSKLNFGSP